MKERNEGAADAAAVRSFNLHLSAPRPRPPARPLQRGPSSERRAAPPFAVDRPTCSGACVRGSRQKKSTLGFGKRAMADGRTDEKRARRRAHLPCPSGGVRARLTGPDPEKDAWRRRRSRSIGRRRAVCPRPWAPYATKRPSRVRSRWLSKRTLFQLTDGSVDVKTRRTCGREMRLLKCDLFIDPDY